MSVDGSKLLFEGFLQKRKDTMKIKWATYWFRLQNTTLFFYTQKDGSASHLRGSYYIYAVQSVREVQRGSSSRYMFEIIMKNGKRKLLAAETADLRKEWVGHLWQAMRLSTSVVSHSTSTQTEVFDLRDRKSSTPFLTRSENTMGTLPVRPFSAPAPSDCILEESWSAASPIPIAQELHTESTAYSPWPIYQNTPPPSDYQHDRGDCVNTLTGSSELSNTECSQEGDYDVLPLRRKMCEVDASEETDEGVYDYPQTYRMNNQPQDPTESIYDVPSSLLTLEDTAGSAAMEEQPEEETYWRL